MSRNIKHIELAMNVRSLFNIGNGLEFERYLDPQLQDVKRGDYLQVLIHNMQSELYQD